MANSGDGIKIEKGSGFKGSGLRLLASGFLKPFLVRIRSLKGGNKK